MKRFGILIAYFENPFEKLISLIFFKKANNIVQLLINFIVCIRAFTPHSLFSINLVYIHLALLHLLTSQLFQLSMNADYSFTPYVMVLHLSLGFEVVLLNENKLY